MIERYFIGSNFPEDIFLGANLTVTEGKGVSILKTGQPVEAALSASFFLRNDSYAL